MYPNWGEDCFIIHCPIHLSLGFEYKEGICVWCETCVLVGEVYWSRVVLLAALHTK